MDSARRPSPLLSFIGLGALLIAFCALGIYYSLSVPLFETPDEPAHYRYARYLVDEHALPPLVVSQDEWVQGEFHQPPLYYTLSALVTSGIHSDLPLDNDPAMARNPYAKRGLPHEPDNKNAMLHLLPEAPTSSPTALGVHLLRWLGIALSCGTIILVWAIARLILPARPHIALLSAAIAALNPQFVFASAAANNDSLVTLLSTATLWIALRVTQNRDRVWRTPVVLGLLVGAAGLTKLSGLALAVLVPLAYGLRWFTRTDRNFWRDLARPTLVAGAVALAVCGWWYGRNLSLYGDALGMRSYRQIFQVHDDSLPLAESFDLLLESFVSYWGVFGWMNVLTHEAYYLAMRLLCQLAVGGLALRTISSLQRDTGARWTGARLGLTLMGVWVVIMLSMLFRWTQTITRTQGRLMFPAVACVSLFLVLGIEYWVTGSRARKWTRIGLAIGVLVLLAGVSATVPRLTLAPAYAQPPTISLDETPESMQGLDIAFGDNLVLLGYELIDDEIHPGERCHLRLYWLCRSRIHENLTVYAHLFGRHGQRIGTLDTFPGRGNFPTSLWTPGQVVVDDCWVHVNPWGEAPVAAEIRVGVYHTESIELLPTTHLSGQSLSPAPVIGRVRILPHVIKSYRPANVSGALFGDSITLIGSSLPGQAEPGSTISSKLYWRCEATMSRDYTVFLHMIDVSGNIVAQADGQPLDGEYPTSFWLQDQEIEDILDLDLPGDLAPGRYEIRVGLYDVASGQRLTVEGTPTDNNAVIIDAIQIVDSAAP